MTENGANAALGVDILVDGFGPYYSVSRDELFSAFGGSSFLHEEPLVLQVPEFSRNDAHKRVTAHMCMEDLNEFREVVELGFWRIPMGRWKPSRCSEVERSTTGIWSRYVADNLWYNAQSHERLSITAIANSLLTRSMIGLGPMGKRRRVEWRKSTSPKLNGCPSHHVLPTDLPDSSWFARPFLLGCGPCRTRLFSSPTTSSCRITRSLCQLRLKSM